MADASISGFRTIISGEQTVANYVWDAGTLSWVPQVASAGVPTADVNVLNSSIPATQAGTWNIGTVTSITNPVSVTGTFYQATQPVSVSSLPLPSGASTSAKQPAFGAAGSAATDVLTVQGIASMTPFKVDGSAVVQPVSIGSTINVSSKSALTAAAPASASVGTSSAQALASNGSRKGAVFVNRSANTISLAIGAAAVLNSGITLTPNGTWVMDDYTFATGAINAIASAASSTLSIQEFS